MANRFWVGGSATWDGTAGSKWSTTSGGASGAAAPTAADDVFLDANSGAGTVTQGSSGAVCRSLNCTGFTGTFAHTGGVTLNIGDGTAGASSIALKMVAGMTYTALNSFTFVSTSATQQTIDFGGKTTANWVINGAGSSYLLSSASTTGSTNTVTLTTGTLNLNGQTCSWGWFNFGGSSTKVLTLGSSAITLTGGSATQAINGSSTGTTITANTATFTITGTSVGITAAGSLNLNGASIVWTGAGGTITTGGFTGTFTVANFTKTGTAIKTETLLMAGHLTCTGTLTLTGNSAVNRILVSSVTPGTAKTITAAAKSITNVDFMDIAGAGAASPFTGTSLGDALGNSGITFDSPLTLYRVGAGGNWSASNWSLTSGGGTGQRVPLAQDTVNVDSGASGTVTGDMPRMGKDINFTGFAGTYTPATTSEFFGSITFSAGMTVTQAGATNPRGRGSHTITSNGKTWPVTGAGFLQIIAPGGTYTLLDALTVVNQTRLLNGTFDTNGQTVTTAILQKVGTATASLVLGTSTINLTSTAAGDMNNFSQVGLTFSGASATFVVANASANARNFVGSGHTYGTLTYTVAGSTGSLTITGANTFDTINFSDITNARTLTLPASTVTTILTSFNVNGTAGKLMTVNSSTGGTKANLSKSSGSVWVRYVALVDNNGQGGAEFYYDDNSTTSNVTGWTKASIFAAGTIASEEAFGSPTISVGVVTVSPTGIATAEAMGSPTLTTGAVTVSPSGIGTAEAVGSPTLTVGAVTVSPTGIASDEAVGSPTLSVGTVTVSPTGIGSEETFGTPTVTVAGGGEQILEPTGIATAEAFGTPTLSVGAVTVSPVGIPSTEAMGTPTLTVGSVTVEPSGIGSGEAIGTPAVNVGGVTVQPASIASDEAIGTPSITVGPFTIAPQGIPTQEALGSPTLTVGSVTISPIGIGSEEAFGIPILAHVAPTVPGRVTVSASAAGASVGDSLLAGVGVSASPRGQVVVSDS